MRIYPSFILAIATLLGNRGWAAEPTNTPVVWQEIPVPDALLQITEIDGQPLTFGGDIRIGDLDGDGEIVVLRSTDNAMKPCFLGAFDLDGNMLWQIGSGGDQPARPGPVTLYDFNGDGADEVLHFWHDPAIETPVENRADVVSSSAMEDLVNSSGNPPRRSSPRHPAPAPTGCINALSSPTFAAPLAPGISS